MTQRENFAIEGAQNALEKIIIFLNSHLKAKTDEYPVSKDQ